MGWLSDYKYRKKLTITGSMGAGNGYQVLLKIGESAGSSGADFHLEGHAANFPNDIRFTASDGITEYNYWIEKIEGTAPDRIAYVWVKVNESLDSDVNLYVYYGNPVAVSTSNGDATFELFDDFNRAWLGDGTDIWNVWIEGNGSAYIDYDGRAILESDELKATSIIFKHNIPSTTQFELHYKFYREIVSPGANEVWLNLFDTNGNMFRVGYSEDYYYAQQSVDGNFITLEQIPRQSPNEFKCVKFVYTTDNLYYYENDVLIGTYANPFSADVGIIFGFSSWDLSRMILDDFFFRTIYATEPTFVVDAVVEEAKILYGIFECLLAKKNDFRYVTLNSIGVDWINKHISVLDVQKLEEINFNILVELVETAQDLLVICRTLIETADKYLTEAEKTKLYNTINEAVKLFRTLGGVIDDGKS